MKARWLDSAGTIAEDVLAENGVFYRRLATDHAAYRDPLDRVKLERGYIEEDVIELRPETPNLQAICAKFEGEHRHDDDEVRFVLGGEGIFDIRSLDDRWMRVEVYSGDLIVVPKDRHHRFLLTDQKAIRCVRLFRDTTGWLPHYRSD
jgi:1,2-dihydroxy-3-keto-5-methylthiopentene dioxygenase